MKVAIFGSAGYEKPFFDKANQSGKLELTYFPESINPQTVHLANGYSAISCFITDQLDAQILKSLAINGIKLIALRSAGYDHVDLEAAEAQGITVVNAATYSPNAIAELATLLTLGLLRHLKTTLQQVDVNNFSLQHLLGKSIVGTTVGIIGTGSIGSTFAKIMHGFGANLLGSDPNPNPAVKQYGLNYVELEELLQHSDIISLHCLLNSTTHHLINSKTINHIKLGAILINTSRGGVVDTQAILSALQSGKLGGFGMDVYEHEKGLFFRDHSGKNIDDKIFNTLKAFPNVIITPHCAFFTETALNNIARTTLDNIINFLNGKITNQVKSSQSREPNK